MGRRRTIIGIPGALLAAAALVLPALAPRSQAFAGSTQPASAQPPSAQPIAARSGSVRAAAPRAISAHSVAMRPTAAQESAFQPDAIQATAVRALRWAFYAPNGYRWEYSGILIRRNGELGYSEFPRTLRKVDAVEMDPSKQQAPGDMLVALYHTHPCKPREYFPQYYSPQDLISAFFWHVPTFILDECTGDVHEFDPALDQVRDTGIVVEIQTKSGRTRRVRLPAGRIVGNIGDRGPDLSAIEHLVNRTLY
jgi:hypothetical protein